MTTFFISDERMLKHKCEWDNSHIERPDRLKWILEKLRKSDLLSKCIKLESRIAKTEELELVHPKDYISIIKNTPTMSIEDQEKLCAEYEDIYLNKYSHECAILSAGCALELTETIIRSNDPNANGFAAIRPPGHHASADKACGFCLFNNVAICAKKAVSMGLKRVLIVDWDVHAGQGTQYAIRDDPNIRLVSIHRFEEGTFWPQLPESSIIHDYANTLNLPLNSTQHEDNDYISIMCTMILPLIQNWRPELILVSCGFDAGMGDPEGEMNVTPFGFGTMAGLLACQNIPLVCLLEGGYFLENIGESSVAVLKALIDRNAPAMFIEKIGPSKDLLHSLLHAFHVYQSIIGADLLGCVNSVRKQRKLSAISSFNENEYKGERELKFPFTTRGLYAPRSTEVEEAFVKKLHEIIIEREETERKSLKLVLNDKKRRIELLFDTELLNLHLESFIDLLFVYHFVLLPLTIKYKIISTQNIYNFSDYVTTFNFSYAFDGLLSKKLITDIVELPENFGFW